MTRPLNFSDVDVDALASRVADAVEDRIGPLLARTTRKLVDRSTMAELANISIPSLDRLVASRRIPSLLVGTRRLFEPDMVISTLVATGAENKE